MDQLTSPSTIKYIMEKYGFSFSKSLGQNFIINPIILNKILDGAGIDEATSILEIGPGIGVMTNEMAKRGKKVVAVEIDSSLIPVLGETLAEHDNVKVINEDILKLDLEKLFEEEFEGTSPKLIANLPYYVTTPIIMKFLEEKINVSEIVIMIQKEVAMRIMAKEGSKTYGALSVAVQYFAEPSIVTHVSKGCFMPPPKIDSTVIKLKVRKKPVVELSDEALFFKVVKDAFGKRRKTLLNALSSGQLQIPKETLKIVFDKVSVSPSARAETLSIEEFANIANELFNEMR